MDTKINKLNPNIKVSASTNQNLCKSKNVHNKENIEKLQKEIDEKDKNISHLETKIANIEKKTQL